MKTVNTQYGYYVTYQDDDTKNYIIEMYSNRTSSMTVMFELGNDPDVAPEILADATDDYCMKEFIQELIDNNIEYFKRRFATKEQFDDDDYYYQTLDDLETVVKQQFPDEDSQEAVQENIYLVLCETLGFNEL